MISSLLGAFRVLFERQNVVEEILKQKGLATDKDLLALQREHSADTWKLLELVAEEISGLKTVNPDERTPAGCPKHAKDEHEMKFVFEKWEKETFFVPFTRRNEWRYSTPFTVNNIPFFANLETLDSDSIFIFDKPGGEVLTIVYQSMRENNTDNIETAIVNHFKNVVRLADLIRNENSKITEATQ